MCILCGEFVGQVHWSEVEKGLTGNQVTVGARQGVIKKARLRRVNICNDIFKLYGLELKEWHNTKYILSNNRGKTFLLNNLAEVWAQVEKLLGYAIDPLDKNLLDKMAKRS